MALTTWMKDFDMETSEWLARLEADENHNIYYDLLNEQPSIDPYVQNTAYQHHLDLIENALAIELAGRAWYKEIIHLRRMLYKTKQQIFTLRVLQEAFGADKIKHSRIDEWPDYSFSLLYKDDKFSIGFEFNDCAGPGPEEFVSCGTGKPFLLISDFVDFMKPYVHHCKYNYKIDEEIVTALENGDLATIIAKHNSGSAFNAHIMDRAAQLGYLDIVKFLHENRTEGCSNGAMDLAAEHGHIHVVKFLQENRTEGCTEYAIVNGNLEIVEYLLPFYPQYIKKLNDEQYEKVIPIIQKMFAGTFSKIKKENIVKEFLAKRLIYHPTASYMKRLVDNF